MPKVDSFQIKIKTGQNGRATPPVFKINGFELPFEDSEGGLGSGETFTGKGSPQSMAHSLHLVGPGEGEWDTEETTITYQCSGEEPYTVRLGSVTLDSDSDMNIWHERPLPVFDV